MSHSAETVQFLKDKWTAIGTNSALAHAFTTECRRHISQGGGALWISYQSRDQTDPVWVFVSKDDYLWNRIPQFIGNFEELIRDYDPEKHCLMFLSVPHTDTTRGHIGGMYGQMIRINYDRDCSTPEAEAAKLNAARDPDHEGNNGEGIWGFKL